MDNWPTLVCLHCVTIIKSIKELGEKILVSQDQLLRLIPSSSGKDLDPLAIDPYLIDRTPTMFQPSDRHEDQCQKEDIEASGMLLESELERRNLLTCLVCHMQTPSLVDHMEHSLRVHRRIGIISCCKETFYGQDALNHMKYHENENAFQCPKCKVNFKSAEKLDKHWRTPCYSVSENSVAEIDLQGSSLECSKCKLKFVSDESLQRHLKFVCDRINAPSVKLNVQEKSFAKSVKVLCAPIRVKLDNSKTPTVRDQKEYIDYEAPKEELRKRNLLICSICKVKEVSWDSFLSHMRNKHGGKSRISCCKRFFYSVDILDHMRYHLDENAFECIECERQFLCGRTLRYHLKKGCSSEIVDLTLPQSDNMEVQEEQSFEEVTANEVPREIKRHFSNEEIETELRKRNLLICSLCNVEEVSWKGLITHMMDKHGGKFLISCCDVEFNAVDILDHMKYHLDENAFKCNKCKEKFLCGRSHKMHLKNSCTTKISAVATDETLSMNVDMEVEEEPSEKGLKEVNANEVPSEIKRNFSYEEIERELRKRKLLTCSLCNVEEESRHSLISHMRNKHEAKCYISCCDVKFNAVEIMDHIRIHLMEPPSETIEEEDIQTITDSDLEQELRQRNLLVCHICTGETESFEDLMDHFVEEHNEPGFIFCCNVKFQRETALEHIKFHINEDLFKCGVCGAMYTTAPELKAHTKRYHTEKKKKLYPCDICGMKLSSNTVLINHKKTHLAHREFAFVCEVCGKGYDIQSQLTAHLYTHNRVKKTEQCLICGKHVFMLKQHITQCHSDRNQKEICEICGIEYLSRGRHKLRCNKSLTRSLDFKCSICNKAFGQLKQLKQHRHVHEGIRVKCRFCDHTASNRTNSGSHMKLKHPEEYELYKVQNNRFLEPRVNPKS